MNSLIATVNAVTMTSREAADLVEARHNDVVATIERLFGKGLLRSSRKTRREETGGLSNLQFMCRHHNSAKGDRQ
jgi:phage regulator Rha-like protein